MKILRHDFISYQIRGISFGQSGISNNQNDFISKVMLTAEPSSPCVVLRWKDWSNDRRRPNDESAFYDNLSNWRPRPPNPSQYTYATTTTTFIGGVKNQSFFVWIYTFLVDGLQGLAKYNLLYFSIVVI